MDNENENQNENGDGNGNENGNENDCLGAEGVLRHHLVCLRAGIRGRHQPLSLLGFQARCLLPDVSLAARGHYPECQRGLSAAAFRPCGGTDGGVLLPLLSGIRRYGAARVREYTGDTLENHFLPAPHTAAALDGHRHPWWPERIDDQHRTGVLLAESVPQPCGGESRVQLPLFAEPPVGRPLAV